jgi:hypothetical protein
MMKTVSELEDIFGNLYCTSSVIESLDYQYIKY